MVSVLCDRKLMILNRQEQDQRFIYFGMIDLVVVNSDDFLINCCIIKHKQTDG